MNNTKQNIAIIIPFYNGDKYISGCINSLITAFSKIDIEHKIFIVDNSDVKSSVIYNLEYEPLKIIKAKSKIGFGRACNIGAFQAKKEKFDIILFLNQDTIIEEHFFIYLFNENKFFLPSNIIFPLIFNSNKFCELYNTEYDKYLLDNKSFINDFKSDNLNAIYDLKLYSGCCFVISTNRFFKIGMFDPIYYMYGEDYDFFWRANYYKTELILLTSLKVYHKHQLNKSTKSNVFFAKWHGRSLIINKIRWRISIYVKLRKSIHVLRKNSISSLFEMFLLILKLLFSFNKINNKRNDLIYKRAIYYINNDLLYL